MAERHGVMSNNPSWRDSRWCAVCNKYHGDLYPCKHYDESTLAEIKAEKERFAQDLCDPTWVKEQLGKGIPPEVIWSHKLFMGM